RIVPALPLSPSQDLPPEPARTAVMPALRQAATTVLQRLARFYLSRVRPRSIAIAGLQGKTVMKRWLREMFSPSLRVRAGQRSYNTELGLPLAILDVAIEPGVAGGLQAIVRAGLRGLFATERLDLLILEMGVRRPGDARALLRAVIPDLLVLTPITPSYANDLSFLADAEAEIAVLAREVAKGGGRIIACADDQRVMDAVRGITGVRTFGLDQVEQQGERFRLAIDGRTFDVGIDVIGESSLYALLAGIEVAASIGVPDADVRKFLSGPAAPGRV
ncbi:MAG: hypothetical protein ACREQQ_06795, partial [Candidatus Binatia bacterium]